MINKQTPQTFHKSEYLYGQMNIWRVMLRVGITGILIAFFSGLFTFIDQLLLVNLMPNTTTYDFSHLFLQTNVFYALHLPANTSYAQHLIQAIAYANSWGFYNSDSVVRAGVSLTVGVSDFMYVVPAIFSIGLSVQYGIALGQGNLKHAKKIWQNAFYGTIFVTLIGMIITFILTAFVIPAQSIINQVTSQDLYVNNYGLVNANTIYANSNNFYVAIWNNHKITGYLLLNSALNDLTSYHVINIIHATQTFTFNSSVLIHTWNNYFALSRHYSIIWAQDFCYIYTGGLLLFSFASLIITLLRNEGVIYGVTIINISVVFINILLDFLLIKYAQIGMSGAATASVLGWLMEFILCYTYLKLNKKLAVHVSVADLKWNKDLRLQFKLMCSLTWFGFSVFVGSIGISIFDILLTREVSIVAVNIMGNVGSEYYLSVLGAILPIVNLFVMSLIGLIQYASPVFSYNYGKQHYKRFISAFWSSSIYALIFSFVIYFIICFIPACYNGILSWFEITPTSPNNELLSAVKLLRIWMIQLIGFALAMGGMLSWLTSNRAEWNTFFNLIRPFVFFIGILYIFSFIAINDKSSLNSALSISDLNAPYDNNAIWFFMWNVPTSSLLGSAIWFISTIVYIYKYVDKLKKEWKIKRKVAKNLIN